MFRILTLTCGFRKILKVIVKQARVFQEHNLARSFKNLLSCIVRITKLNFQVIGITLLTYLTFVFI